MKQYQITILVIFAAALFTGCKKETPMGTTTLELEGTEGIVFKGFYIADGERIEVEGHVPKTIESENITRCEFYKINQDDTLSLKARNSMTFVNPIAGQGIIGVWADMKNKRTGTFKQKTE